MDDYCPKRGMRGEHGLSLYMETMNTNLLLDSGQSEAFLENARILGIDLPKLDAVVLSHGHYDHGGGLNALYSMLSALPPPLFVGRGFDALRRSRSEKGLNDIGLPVMILPAGAPAPIVIDTFEKFGPDTYILPRVERIDGEEALPKFRVIKGGSERIDDFDDELSLIFDEEDGIVIVTGCAHRGIINITRSAMQAFPGRPVKALVGGFHLVDASADTISRVARDIAEIDPAMVLCAHCTGLGGFAALSDALCGRVSWLSCGMNISI